MIGATKEQRLLFRLQEKRLANARALLVRALDALNEVRVGRLDSFTFAAIAEINQQIALYLAETEP